MYSNTLVYNKCQTYIEVSYLFYNYYFFYYWKIFANYISEKGMKLSVFLSLDILLVLLEGQRQNSWLDVVPTSHTLKKNVFCIEWFHCFNESQAVEYSIVIQMDA